MSPPSPRLWQRPPPTPAWAWRRGRRRRGGVQKTPWVGRRRWAAAVALLCQCGSCAGAGGKSIFMLGDQIDEKAFTVMYYYLIVFVVTIGIEVGVHALHHHVTTETGTHVVHHVTQEVMILGGISAVLITFENLGGAAYINAGLFHFVHFVIFLMMIAFIFLVSSLFFLVKRSWRKWVDFESGLEQIICDPSVTRAEQSAFIQQYIMQMKDGHKTFAAVTFYKQSLPERLQLVTFARYVMKQERKFLLTFIHLHPSSWGLLALLCLGTAIVTEVVMLIAKKNNDLAIMSQWTIWVGLTPFIIILICYYKVRHSFRLFVTDTQQMRNEGSLKPIRPLRDYHITIPFICSTRTPAHTVKIIQTMLHFEVYFLANAITNFAYRLFSEPAGPYILLGMFMCPLSVFLFLVPRILPPFTVLASLGEYTNHETILKMVIDAKTSGKCRRAWNRDNMITEVPPFMSEDRDKYRIVTEMQHGAKKGPDILRPAWGENQRPSDIGAMPEALIGGDRDGKEKPDAEGRLPEVRKPRQKWGGQHNLCRECKQAHSVVYCPNCQMMLCQDCDGNYHRLRLLRDHMRWTVGEAAIQKAKPWWKGGFSPRGRGGTVHVPDADNDDDDDADKKPTNPEDIPKVRGRNRAKSVIR